MEKVLENILRLKKNNQKAIAILIDPDNLSRELLIEQVELAKINSVDFFFIGGSMITIKNPLILKHENIGFVTDEEKKYGPPRMEIRIKQLEIDDASDILSIAQKINEERLTVNFFDAHIWLEHDGNDFETHFDGKYEVTIINKEITKQSIILNVDFNCIVEC